MALFVLVEKMNVTEADLKNYSGSQLARACNNAIRGQFKKVIRV